MILKRIYFAPLLVAGAAAVSIAAAPLAAADDSRYPAMSRPPPP
jgi:hypothetical protein